MENIVPVVATISMMIITLIIIPGALIYLVVQTIRTTRKRAAFHQAIKVLKKRSLQELKTWLAQTNVLEYHNQREFSYDGPGPFGYPHNLNIGALTGYGQMWQVRMDDLAILLSSIVHNKVIGVDVVAREVLRMIPNHKQRTKLYSLMKKSRHQEAAETLCQEVRRVKNAEKSENKRESEEALITRSKNLFAPKKGPRPLAD